MTGKSTSEFIEYETKGSPYVCTTHDIQIIVVPRFMEEGSTPDDNVYSFAYTITIRNLKAEAIQLLRRHWIVTSGGVKINEIIGKGVVGLEPVIRPSDSFTYTSGVVIHDAEGAMQGDYIFRTEGGEDLEVAIPQFDLLYPGFFH